VPVEHACPSELEPAVQGRLPAERERDRVDAFFDDDSFHELGRDGGEVDLVRQTLARLDGRDVGVHEHREHPRLLEGLDRL